MSSPNPDKPPGSDHTSKETEQSRKEKILAQAAELISKAEAAQAASKLAFERAEKISDPKQKQEELEEATKQEKIAKEAFKAAGRLQSGVWQGGAAGAGIGAGVGAGVGTLVGTVVGGIASIPTTGLGLLVGAGTGAIHGPWFKIGKDGEKEEVEAEEVDGVIVEKK